ncbi:MAG: hypothetical protein JSU85_07125 [Candidatus Zixiibacteriota bacterium]|nr:MAG: hypothetical protein JSU85_07125 [candidate division Zixibacteria bacterium]
MKVNIVSDATYYPSKINRQGISNKEIKPADGRSRGVSRFEKLFLEKLSAEEAAAIQRLFGDFKIEDVGKNLGGNVSIAGKLSSIPRGSFVDIKI